MDIRYSGNNIEDKIKDIKSWESCSMLCEDESECFAWSFNKFKDSCFLKDENWKSGWGDFKGFISGTKNCIGSTTTTTPKSTTPQSTTVSTTQGIYHSLSKNQGKGRNQNFKTFPFIRAYS